MSFQKSKLENGESNPKYVDVLDEDKAISGQKFVCVSFLSPDKILTQKDQFFFQEFIKFYDFQQYLQKYQNFLGIGSKFLQTMSIHLQTKSANIHY